MNKLSVSILWCIYCFVLAPLMAILNIVKGHYVAAAIWILGGGYTFFTTRKVFLTPLWKRFRLCLSLFMSDTYLCITFHKKNNTAKVNVSMYATKDDIHFGLTALNDAIVDKTLEEAAINEVEKILKG